MKHQPNPGQLWVGLAAMAGFGMRTVCNTKKLRDAWDGSDVEHACGEFRMKQGGQAGEGNLIITKVNVEERAGGHKISRWGRRWEERLCWEGKGIFQKKRDIMSGEVQLKLEALWGISNRKKHKWTIHKHNRRYQPIVSETPGSYGIQD